MRKHNMNNNQRGLTLLELMIVVAIIGLLGAVAYPVYTNAVAKSEREDAISALLKQQGQMEEFYINNDTYAGAPLFSATSQRGKYDMSIDEADAYSYKITATRNDGGDSECSTLSLDNLGQKTATGDTPGNCW